MVLQPSLDTVDKNRRMIHSVDFRSMYGSLLDGWLGGGGGSIVNGSFENLDLFAAGTRWERWLAGAMRIVYVTPPSDRSGYVPLTPTRVVDTRDGTGDWLGPIGPGETWTFTFRNKFGIPADAVAVAMNLTSVNVTEPTFVTVFPAGDTRPFTANLNPVPGLAVPNLVVGRTSAAGAVSFYNNSGSVDLVADRLLQDVGQREADAAHTDPPARRVTAPGDPRPARWGPAKRSTSSSSTVATCRRRRPWWH